MSILHIPDSKNLSKLKKEIKSGKKPIAILVYMEGCGPCNATRPEWNKIQSQKNVLVVDLNKDLLDKELEQFIGGIDGFPTMKIIHPNGNKIDYNGDRTAKDLIQWIDSHIDVKKGGKKSKRRRRITRRRKRLRTKIRQ